MAGIGLYGVYYSQGTYEDGVLSHYNGVKTMGKAISATFTPQEAGDSKLYANNAVSETDAQAGAGGTLGLTLDKLLSAAYVDLFGLTEKTKTVTVGTTTATGKGYDYTGNEQSNAVGVAFIRQRQEAQDRDIHEAVIFSAVTFKTPTDEYNTLGETVEWQTPSIEGDVTAGASIGTFPWMQRYTFPTQAAAIQFITDFFAAPPSGGEGGGDGDGDPELQD